MTKTLMLNRFELNDAKIINDNNKILKNVIGLKKGYKLIKE